MDGSFSVRRWGLALVGVTVAGCVAYDENPARTEPANAGPVRDAVNAQSTRQATRSTLEAELASDQAEGPATKPQKKKLVASPDVDEGERTNSKGDNLNKIAVPPYAGERYEAEVPDTLDLAERAVLAINAMTRVVDPEREYELYFVAEFAEDPPKLYHDWCGIFNTTKFLEALPLMRIMSGSDYNIDVDSKMMESYLRGAGNDGLYYRPVANLPWAFYAEHGTEEVTMTRDPYGFTFGEGRLIMAMCRWYQHDHNPLWKKHIEKKIQRLLEMGYKKNGAISFERFFLPGHVIAEEPPVGIDSWVPYGAITYYQLTGHAPALELAQVQVRHLRKWFDEDGRFLKGHFHLSAAALIEMLEYAISANDRSLIDVVRNGYGYGKEVGEPLIGFFPEDATKDFPTCESCAVADMVYLAIRLTQIGVGDYWEDADRWVRNQFVENQMTRADWADPQKILARQTIESRKRICRQMQMTEKMKGIADAKDAVERCVGSWSGWGTANDWVSPQRAGIMQCCTGNAARTLYYAWDNIVTADEDSVHVNFLLNRASPWLDVDSHLPFEGKVVLKNKAAQRLSVRIPEGTTREQVVCAVNGEKHETAWSGNYIEVNSIKKGDLIAMEFPMVEKTILKVIGGVSYKLTLKGNTVVDISPRGEMYPLYRRDHLQLNKAPLKRTSRFVSKENVNRSRPPISGTQRPG